MIPYKKINNLTGWFVFIIATVVYALTVEETASFWDCGEFIAVSYKLEVPHPPGAPFYLLMGRMFSFLAGGDVTEVAYWINMISVLSSGFTILFLFWTITLLGKKILKVKEGEETLHQTLLLMGAALIGSLAYTFSDSFWFSATEAEVYALSSFFTAFVFWAILKWELITDEAAANRWLILIAYMMGLSIGVHLLNLVTVPALGLIYYFHKHTPKRRGIILTLAISFGIILLIMYGIIPGLPSLAGSFEVFFINNIGLPFGSGVIILGLLIVGGIVYGIIYSTKKEKPVLNMALLSLSFILIGYASYSLVVIRSNYNPPIDENNPETIISFVSYLKREQYGSRPLVRGQYFDAELTEQKQGAPVYERGEDKYEITDYKIENVYDPNRTTILPRIYSTQGNHKQLYRQWIGLRENEKPNFADNIVFLFRYQLGHMYMRYFMWNFAGRESDIKEATWLMPWDTDEGVPEVIANNKARNNYFLLPLLLGIIGLFYQYRKDAKSFVVVFFLFILTGVALVLYLNSPPVEPRERDYIYVGSFYAFAMWIGFGVMGVARFLAQFVKNKKAVPVLATTLTLVVPIIMAVQGWDDHDRSDRYFSVDSAKNFLASCAPNAILFTGGDNDTFPLWYAQEVEGFRTDVRVIVLSYFNTDWYIEQMTRPAYESEPLPFSLQEEHYRQGGPNDYLPYVENPNVQGAINLEQYLNLIRKNSPALKLRGSMSSYNTVPARQFYVNIDTTQVLNMVRKAFSENGEVITENQGLIPADKKDLLTDKMFLQLKGSALEKKDLMILDLIAANNWERPIYFNNTSLQGVNIDVKNYVVQEGNAYRLLPVENPETNTELVNTDIMYANMMQNFYWRQLDNPDVYYNEDYRNFVLNHRSSFNSLAETLLQEGNREKAREVLNKSLEVMPDAAIPYDYVTAQSVQLLFRAGEEEKAIEIAEIVGDRADEMLTYLAENNMQGGYERQKRLIILNELARSLKNAGQSDLAQKYEEAFARHYNQMRM